MKNNISWKEKYMLSITENLSLKEICLLCDVGTTRASKIRQEALNYCLMNDISIDGRKVATEAVLAVIHHDINFYYNRMLLEHKAAVLEVA